MRKLCFMIVLLFMFTINFSYADNNEYHCELKVDKNIFHTGENLPIEIYTQKRSKGISATITYEIYHIDSKKTVRVGQENTDTNGKKEILFNIANNWMTGKYKIRVKAFGKNYEKFINVTNNQVFVDSNKNVYKAGDQVTLNGFVKKNEDNMVGVDVTIKVENSQNNYPIITGQVKTDHDGKFQYVFNIKEATASGKYMATVQALNHYGYVTFDIKGTDSGKETTGGGGASSGGATGGPSGGGGGGGAAVKKEMNNKIKNKDIKIINNIATIERKKENKIFITKEAVDELKKYRNVNVLMKKANLIISKDAFENIKNGINIELKEMDTNKKENGYILGKAYEFKFYNEDGKALNIYKNIKGSFSKDLLKNLNEDPMKAALYSIKNEKIEFVSHKIDEEINIEKDTLYVVGVYNKKFLDTNNHWAKNAIEIMASQHILKGVSNNYFEPDRSITRAEFATIICKTFHINKTVNQSRFTDVDENAWYAQYVLALSELGIVNGYDGKFNPNESITREEMTVMIMNTIEKLNLKMDEHKDSVSFKDSKNISSWASESIENATKLGLITGNTNQEFMPKEDTKRAEACVVMYKVLKAVLEQ